MRGILTAACLAAAATALAAGPFRMNPDLVELPDNTWREMDPKFVYHPDQFPMLEKIGWKLKDLPLKPGGRFCHVKAEAAFCYDESANLTIYFGGCTSGYGNNHWVYDCSSNTWTQIHPDIFKIREINGIKWRYREDTKSHPPGCCCYGICYDSYHKVSVLARPNGGATAWVKPPGPPNNYIWLYDAAKRKWGFTPRNGEVPHVYMTGVRMAYDPESRESLLVNGRTLWAYSIATNAWRRIDVKGPAPETAGLNSWAYMDREKKFLLFRSPRKKNTKTDTTWLYDPKTCTWEDVTQEDGPALRAGAAMAYDSLNNVAAMIGGWNVAPSKKLNDGTWVFDPTKKTWTRHQPDPMPKVTGSCYQMSYDKVNNVMIYVSWAKTWIYRYRRGTEGRSAASRTRE
jgi:hypothetical protein